MTSSPQLARVLVAGNDAAEVGRVHDLLCAEFPLVEVSTGPDPDLAHLQRVKPQVLLLVYGDLAAAERHRVAVADACHDAAQPVPRMLVACAQDDAAAAFELCKQAVFDDYVPHGPEAGDAHRLVMAVWNAHRQASALDAAARAAAAVPATADEQAARPRVMVVEDDAFAAKLIAKALEPQPWSVVFASEADEALMLLEGPPPSLILMDVKLPGMDGVALTERLKVNPALAGIPVVMVTGEATRETLKRSMDVGAAGFIVKPFTRDALVAKIGKFLA